MDVNLTVNQHYYKNYSFGSVYCFKKSDEKSANEFFNDCIKLGFHIKAKEKNSRGKCSKQTILVKEK